jgi:hypothetical protein
LHPGQTLTGETLSAGATVYYLVKVSDPTYKFTILLGSVLGEGDGAPDTKLWLYSHDDTLIIDGQDNDPESFWYKPSNASSNRTVENSSFNTCGYYQVRVAGVDGSESGTFNITMAAEVGPVTGQPGWWLQTGIPSSATGLVSGQVWNNGGTLTVV